jgi:carbon monoxide dehydrogenase subunit G
MASIRKELVTMAQPESVWDAIRDVGALHTRLVPGFVIDTRLEPGARKVTFANGMVIREPIVTIDEEQRRLVWSAEGGGLTHYNASIQVFNRNGGGLVVWLTDFLPDDAAKVVGPMMDQGLAAMKRALDGPPR